MTSSMITTEFYNKNEIGSVHSDIVRQADRLSNKGTTYRNYLAS